LDLPSLRKHRYLEGFPSNGERASRRRIAKRAIAMANCRVQGAAPREIDLALATDWPQDSVVRAPRWMIVAASALARV
jgi:hypothetical protein